MKMRLPVLIFWASLLLAQGFTPIPPSDESDYIPGPEEAVFEEELQELVLQDLLDPDTGHEGVDQAVTPAAAKSQVDALWDFSLVVDNQNNLTQMRTGLNKLNLNVLSAADLARVLILSDKAQQDATKISRIKNLLRQSLRSDLTSRDVYVLMNQKDALGRLDINTSLAESLGRYQDSVNYYSSVANKSILGSQNIQELFHYDPPLSRVLGGQYNDAARLYVFCRKDRSYPCRLLMRDKDGHPIYSNQNGSLWSLPMLAMSKYQLSSSHESGNTPAGVYVVNSVMPTADKQLEYGKNRRLIINFAPAGSRFATLKELIPTSSHDKAWWHQTFVAKEVGRNNLRIHGTGLMNSDAQSAWYPLVPSQGCLKLREGIYDKTYNDQRVFLDKFMQAQGLSATYNNEIKLKALLYVVEIDDQKKAVSENEVAELIR